MILVAIIFRQASKIVSSNNNYLFLQFSNTNLWDKRKKVGKHVQISINLWSYDFSKSFYLYFFLLIKTYLKKRKTWTRSFYKCWKWYCGYHKNVIGPNTFVTLYGFGTKIYQSKQKLMGFFKMGQWLCQVSPIVTKIYLLFLKTKLIMVSLKSQ